MEGSVDGVALGVATDGGIARVDVGQIAFAPEDGGDVSLISGGVDGLLHILVHAAVGAEIAVHQRLGLGARDAEAL